MEKGGAEAHFEAWGGGGVLRPTLAMLANSLKLRMLIWLSLLVTMQNS
jgi:hypothetical protein